jgi:predicted nucleotidyltransferase
VSIVSRKPAVTSVIDNMVKRIVAKFHPEKIIVFGSQVRGTAGPNSDVDLLVVMPVEGSPWETGLKIRHALHDFPVPLDVIVTRPEDFAWRKEIVCTIEWIATKEGKVRYAKS